MRHQANCGRKASLASLPTVHPFRPASIANGRPYIEIKLRFEDGPWMEKQQHRTHTHTHTYAHLAQNRERILRQRNRLSPPASASFRTLKSKTCNTLRLSRPSNLRSTEENQRFPLQLGLSADLASASAPASDYDRQKESVRLETVPLELIPDAANFVHLFRTEKKSMSTAERRSRCCLAGFSSSCAKT